MTPCPRCGTELSYVHQYGQWYCNKCRRYPWQYPQQRYPPVTPPPPLKSKRKQVIIIVVVLVMVVFMAIIPRVVLHFWVMSLEDTGEEALKFPTIEVTLMDSPTGDSLEIKHIAGYPLDWSDYKIILTNQSNMRDTSTITSLSGIITAGETTAFTSEGTSGFSNIDFQRTKAYQIDIYNIKENKHVWEKKNVICE